MRQLQQAIVEGGRAEEDARVTAGDGIGLHARVFQRMPCNLQGDPLLRVHAGGFAVCDREERVVELVQAVQESAMAYRAVLIPARGDAAAAFRQQAPVGGKAARTRKAARHADDHDGIRVASRRADVLPPRTAALDPAAQVAGELPDVGMVIELGGINLYAEPGGEFGRQAGRFDRAEPVFRERAIGADARLGYLRDFRDASREESFHVGRTREARSRRGRNGWLGVAASFPLRDDPQAVIEKRPLRLAALDLAAGRPGRGAGLYQHRSFHGQIERGADCAPDRVEHLVVGAAAMRTREFLDDDDPFLRIARDREHRATAWREAGVGALDLAFRILRVVVIPVDDDEVLHAARREDITLVDESEVSGSEILRAVPVAG